MKLMFKEEIARRKLPFVYGNMLLLPSVITLDGLTNIYTIDIISNTIYGVLFTFIIILSYVKSNIKFRYSLICDEFIIHKIQRKNNVMLKNIKINEIEKINIIKGPSKYFILLSIKNNFCPFNTNKLYKIEYNNLGNLESVYLQPSEIFVNKLMEYCALKSKKIS